MGLKDNFRQAAKELMSTPEQPTGRGPAEEPRYDHAERPAPRMEREGAYSAPTPRETPPPSYGETRFGPQRTVISADTVVQGSITSSCGVEIFGEVYGDVTSQEDLKLCGRLEGNVNSKDVALSGGKLKGDVAATGQVRIDGASIVLGNLQADTLTLNGKVKGDLDVAESLIMESDAAVLGRILAGRITMSDGAIIQGEVHIRTNELGGLFPDDLFEDDGAAGKRH